LQKIAKEKTLWKRETTIIESLQLEIRGMKKRNWRSKPQQRRNKMDIETKGFLLPTIVFDNCVWWWWCADRLEMPPAFVGSVNLGTGNFLVKNSKQG
jgi:hypothetical protein